jgi:hypothetical protein
MENQTVSNLKFPTAENVPTSTVSQFQTVVALFRDHGEAERALRELRTNTPYAPAEIGVAARDRGVQQKLSEGATATHATEGAVTGAVGGGVLGGLAGWLLAIGAITLPGIGPIVAGGALAAALGVTAGTAVAGASIGAAVGGLAGALIGLGIPEEDADYIDKGFREGHIVVTVRAANIEPAVEIFARHGAEIRRSGAGRPISSPAV